MNNIRFNYKIPGSIRTTIHVYGYLFKLYQNFYLLNDGELIALLKIILNKYYENSCSFDSDPDLDFSSFTRSEFCNYFIYKRISEHASLCPERFL